MTTKQSPEQSSSDELAELSAIITRLENAVEASTSARIHGRTSSNRMTHANTMTELYDWQLAHQDNLIKEIIGKLPKLLTEESFEKLKTEYPELDKTDFYHFALDQVTTLLKSYLREETK